MLQSKKDMPGGLHVTRNVYKQTCYWWWCFFFLDRLQSNVRLRKSLLGILHGWQILKQFWGIVKLYAQTSKVIFSPHQTCNIFLSWSPLILAMSNPAITLQASAPAMREREEWVPLRSVSLDMAETHWQKPVETYTTFRIETKCLSYIQFKVWNRLDGNNQAPHVIKQFPKLYVFDHWFV